MFYRNGIHMLMYGNPCVLIWSGIQQYKVTIRHYKVSEQFQAFYIKVFLLIGLTFNMTFMFCMHFVTGPVPVTKLVWNVTAALKARVYSFLEMRSKVLPKQRNLCDATRNTSRAHMKVSFFSLVGIGSNHLKTLSTFCSRNYNQCQLIIIPAL